MRVRESRQLPGILGVVIRPVGAKGYWGGGAGAPNNCQDVVYFLNNSVLSEKKYNGQPPDKNFIPTALVISNHDFMRFGHKDNGRQQ